MGIPTFSLVGAAGSKFGSASVGAYMAGFFPEGFLLQPTAAEMASPMPKTIDLKAAFRRIHVKYNVSFDGTIYQAIAAEFPLI